MTVPYLKGFAKRVGIEPEGKALKGDWIRLISVSLGTLHISLGTLTSRSIRPGTLRIGCRRRETRQETEAEMIPLPLVA
jgi:hypothetical protein